MPTKEKQRWYVATLIIAAKVEGDPNPGSCDEQIRLIRALDADMAYDKALELGKAEETSYPNSYGQTVTWEFLGLVNLEELDSAIRDGIEIRSRLFGHPDPHSIVQPKRNLSVFAARYNPHSSEYLYNEEDTEGEE